MFLESKFHQIWNEIWGAKSELVARSVPKALPGSGSCWVRPPCPQLGRSICIPRFLQDAGTSGAQGSGVAEGSPDMPEAEIQEPSRSEHCFFPAADKVPGMKGSHLIR